MARMYEEDEGDYDDHAQAGSMTRDVDDDDDNDADD